MKNLEKTNGKKVLIILAIIISIISFSAIIYATNTINNPKNIAFEDKNLYDAIKKQLSAKKISYNGNDTEKTIEVSANDIEKIQELDISTSSISNLSGLENFTNLTSLNSSKNTITVAKPLNQLTKLENLNMSENPINTEILSTISNLSTLKELNMTNTQMNGDQLDYFKNLKNLETLILASNNISAIEKISTLTGLTKLDISVNTSFTDFSQVTSFNKLKELNVSGTGITTFEGIKSLANLEKLYAADNKEISSSGIDPIFEMNYDETEKPYLGNIKVLNLSSLGTNGNRPSISFYNISYLTTLEELHLASNEIEDISGITNLINLKYLDLKYNNLTKDSIANLINTDDENDENDESEKSETLKAEKIDLRGNNINNISVLAKYPADIKWLDLSENKIYDISPIAKHSCSKSLGETLYLQDQDITFGLKSKTIDADHYIILPTIFTYGKDSSKFLYEENIKFEYSDGVRLNPDYTKPLEYNVIIDHNKIDEEEQSITIRGGVADGTVLHFETGTTGDIECLIESLVFKDKNLNTAISNKIKSNKDITISYFKEIPLIINVDDYAIDAINELNLQHTDSSVDTKIRDLSGLENFYNLSVLYLQNNDISTIDQLAACTALQTLNLASNSNIKNNNTAISQLPSLRTLNLSNTGMTNLNFLKELKSTNDDLQLTILDLSDNGLTSINEVESITTLQSLAIANEKLTDKNISILSSLTNLTTLNMNGNQIENIDALKNLNQLKYLYFNNNKVQSLEPIKGKVFYELEFTGNKVKDISPLSSHRTINNLKIDNNQIEDVTILSRISMSNEQNLSVTGQKIVRILDSNAADEVSIPLPQIFKASQESGNKIYSTEELLLTKCKLDTTGENIIIDTNSLNNEVAQVEITSGKAKGSTLVISAPLKATITYNPSIENKTNQNVTATISFNNEDDRQITITNNDGEKTYSFEQNGKFTFEFVDKYGIEGSATAVVQNIDKEPPVIISIKQNTSADKVDVNIEVNEKINKIDGWTYAELDEGHVQISKTYYENKDEDIVLTDEAGNTTVANIRAKLQAVSDVLTSDKLVIVEDELKIKQINLKTLVSDFKKNLVAEMDYEILDKNGNKLLDTDKIGTGCQVKMQNGKIYTVIVWGDLNGDGELSLTELARVSKIYAKKVTPSDLEKSAIDINMNGKIDLTELAAISKMYAKK